MTPDGKEGFRQRGGLGQAQARRNGQRIAFMHGAIFGIAAAGDEGANPIAGREAGHAFPGGHHFAGNFQAGDIRGAGRRRIVPLALQHVGAVNAGGGDFHQKLARLRNRHRAFSDDQNLGGARLADFNRFHRAGQRCIC